jgi:hypothetical protein
MTPIHSLAASSSFNTKKDIVIVQTDREIDRKREKG